jgi:hypothetical protein
MTDAFRQTRSHPDLQRWMMPVEVLFQGHAAGAYTLPEQLIEDRAALHRVQSALSKLSAPPDPAVVVEELATAAASAATIKTADLGKKMRAAEDAVDEHLATLHVLRQIETKAGAAVRQTMDQLAYDIADEHLRPAADGVLAEAGELAPKLSGAVTLEAVFRSGDEAGRKAWFELEGLADRWRLIRAAYVEALYRHVFKGDMNANELDLRSLLAYRNWYELPKAPNSVDVQTPTEPAAFMVWLVTGVDGVTPKPWMPLPDEVEQAIEASREHAKAASGVAEARSAMVAGVRKEEREREQREAKRKPGVWSG